MELVGPEPFAVVLADDVIDAETPCIRQLLDVYEFFCSPVLAVMEVPTETISSYGASMPSRFRITAARTGSSASATWSKSPKPARRLLTSLSSAVIS